MIPFASCMCFRGKGAPAQWTSTPGKKQTCVDVSKTADHKIQIFISEKPATTPDDAKRRRPLAISRSEWSLLHALEQCPAPWRPSASYQTPQRKPYSTRLPIIRVDALKSALLDDAYQGITRNILEDCGRWNFNTFHLDVSTGGRSLPVLMAHLFQKYDFFGQFRLDPAEVMRCFSLFESCYHTSNPYHNSVHAADVTQAMHCFLQEKKISRYITPVEAVSAILAAVAHDLDHPGVNQPFLIATSNHLAALYKNFSVLENHHWRVAISCLREAQLFGHLDPDIWGEIEYNIRSMILATDITRQQEFLAKFKRYMVNGELDLEKSQHRLFILQIALKCADLCNPCRPWVISQCWSQQICQEFYKQGEYEKKLNLPITPICDRGRSTIAKIQADFFRFVVTPLFDVWHGFLGSDLSEQLISNLEHNQQSWEQKAREAAEAAARSALAITPVEEQASVVVEEENEDSDASTTDEPLSIIMPSVADDELCVVPWGQRRCSMPLSTPKLLPCTSLRRQSVPHSTRALVASISAAATCNDVSENSHHSSVLSTRTLSSEQLQPRTSIISLSSCETTSLLGLIAKEAHSSRLVHQPVSYPPFVCVPSLKQSRKRCGKLGRKGKGSCRHGSTENADYKKDPDNGGTKAQGQSPTSQLNNAVFSVDSCTTTESTNQVLTFNGQERNGNNSDTESFRVSSEPSTTQCKAEGESSKSDGQGRNIARTTVGTTCLVSPQRTAIRVSEDSQCHTSLGVAFVSECQKDLDVMEQVNSWCSQVSRTMLEERTMPGRHDLDCSVRWWGSSSSSLSSSSNSRAEEGVSRVLQRRGSAPVTTSTHRALTNFLSNTLREKGQSPRKTYGRRWSVAAKPMQYSGTLGQRFDAKPSLNSPALRRHSFGIFEPFTIDHSFASDDDEGSLPTSTGTTCSTRYNSRDEVDIYHTPSEGSCSSESHDMFPTCGSPSLPFSQRRGSLPADIPISLVTRISSYTSNIMPIPGSTDSIANLKYVPNFSASRRASVGEVLSCTTKSVTKSSAQRRSIGHGLGSSGGGGTNFVRLPMGMCSSWQNVCGISKAARSSASVESRISEDVYAMRRHSVRLSAETPGFSEQRWRRGSVPFGLFLLSSTSLGNLTSRGMED